MKQIKELLKIKYINLETLLCIFIVACPILDMVSFLFRNTFDTNFSPSTVLRPVITIVAIIYLFFRNNKKFKIYTAIFGLVYLIYAIIHLYLFNTVLTGSSYSNVVHEAQYIINYTFMILNLCIFIFVFYDKDTTKLKNSVFIAVVIYIISIFIAILTGTSSYTYPEESIGYKGWFESGNSISAILILSMFIVLQYIKNKEYRKIAIPIIALVGLFLTTIIGTRVGLFGFILVLFAYVMVEIICNLINNKKINKKIIMGGMIAIIAIIAIVGIVGSSTLQRRKQLKQEESQIIDQTTNKASSITGDLLKIKNKIENNTLEDGFMGEAEKQSIIDLYNIANNMNLSHTQMRIIQLIYNAELVKNQANPMLMLFGNGYMANFYELVLEMEIPAFLFNFGILGFILYFIPFFGIFAYGIYSGVKNIRKMDSEYVMLLLGSGFTFALSLFSGYTFFNSSSMMIIVVIHTLLLNKIIRISKIQ